MDLTQSEINSILFYQGAVSGIELDLTEGYLKKFYRIHNAYEAINVLLFPGFENEKARLIHEGRQIDTMMLDFMPELLKVYENLYRIMCKYAICMEKRESVYAYRSDRVQTLELLKRGQIPSFFSTSLSKKTNSYFHRKKGILLLEIETSGKIPHLDVNALLGMKSAFPNESEILFPPFLHLEMEQIELDDMEKSYKDMDGNPPEAKYKIYLKESENGLGYAICEDKQTEKLLEKIMDCDCLQRAKDVWRTCASNRFPDKTMEDNYVSWKTDLQQYLRMKYADIYSLLFG